MSESALKKAAVPQHEELLSGVPHEVFRLNRDIFTVIPLTYHITQGSADH
jgi:hypothetical protein